MKKRVFPILIAMLMVFAMMPMAAGTVFADNWTQVAWTSTDSLPTESGSYRLQNDIELSTGYTVPTGADITIDLNGKKVETGSGYQDGYLICVKGKLTITDSFGSGIIMYSTAPMISVEGGELTVLSGHFDGTISANTEGRVSLSGGSYELKPDPKFIANNHIVVNDAGTVGIVKGELTIQLDQTELSLNEGHSSPSLQVTISPENASNQYISWSSSNEDIVSVDDSGHIHANSAGTATITAKCSYNENWNDECAVTVTPGIWWKKDNNKLYLRSGQKEGYTLHDALNTWGYSGFSEVVVENTIHPDDMTDWFNAAEELERIVHPENIDTSNVTSMDCLFFGCKNLESLDLHTWDTSSVQTMRGMFGYCKSLTTLDLTSFEVGNVKEMESMFMGCTALKTIVVSSGSDWANKAPLTDNGSDMFLYCAQLSGEKGTSYNEANTDATYAHIDGGENSPGYFSATNSPIFRVTFEDGMGHVIETKYAKYGEDVTPPDVPTREGYKFDGWDQDCSNITSDLKVTAQWKKLVNIKNVNISIEAPECGTKVELVDYAHGDYGQYSSSPHTHPWPVVTVSSDEVKLFNDPYHGGSEVTGVWTDNEEGNITWQTPNNGYFTGTMEGGNEYYARFSLDAVNGYRFGSDRYDVIKVNGQKPVYVSNDSDTQVVVVAKVKASHVPASETIVKATPGINGSINRTCEKCGNDYSETIQAPKDFLLSKTSYAYSESRNEPSVTVKDAVGNIVDPSNYGVTYKDNINAGTATAIITFKGTRYEGSKSLTFKITKAANPLTMKPKTATVKFSKLKKKAQPLAVTKVINFTKQLNDKKTYTLSSAKKGKKSFKKYFKINKTTGKITVKKGPKKGIYKVKVKVKAAGNANYKPSALKTVTFTVKVK